MTPPDVPPPISPLPVPLRMREAPWPPLLLSITKGPGELEQATAIGINRLVRSRVESHLHHAVGGFSKTGIVKCGTPLIAPTAELDGAAAHSFRRTEGTAGDGSCHGASPVSILPDVTLLNEDTLIAGPPAPDPRIFVLPV